MKSKLLATVGLLMITVLLATSQVSAITNVVTPEFVDHQGEAASFDPAYVEFSTEETILGAHSVKMSIPEGAIPADRWGLGLNVETRLATGMSRIRGLALYSDIFFKVYFEVPEFDPDPMNHAPLYVSLILYDKTNDVWVSMIPTTTLYDAWGGARMSFSTLENGWWIATPVEGSNALWTAWRFDGTPWCPVGTFPWGSPIPRILTLSEWDTYIANSGLNVMVRKVNIQFGYRPSIVHQDWDGDGIPEEHYAGVDWGTVYVDELSFAGRTLDFEP